MGVIVEGRIDRNNDKLRRPLNNYKFVTALRYLEGEHEDVQRIVRALADTFGDHSSFIDGNMTIIVEAALCSIDALWDEGEILSGLPYDENTTYVP